MFKQGDAFPPERSDRHSAFMREHFPHGFDRQIKEEK